MPRVDPVDREIALLLQDELSPEAISGLLADVARDALAEAQADNAEVIGRVPAHDTYVDQVMGAPLESVRPDGIIQFEFQLVDEALLWISTQLARLSPYKTGRFTASHILLADGDEVDIADPPYGASEYIFLNTQPYARKIERGQSPQAPDGVFKGVARGASNRFGNSVQVSFTYRSTVLPYIAGGKNRAERAALKQQPARRSAMAIERETRTPAIIVTPR